MTAYADLVRADGALAYFPLDDASPAAVADASGHGYTGAGPVGPIQSGGAAPFSGSGGSMRFNGAEDISLAAGVGGSSLAALPHGGAPFSYEVWAQPIDNCLGGGNQGGGGLLFVRGTPGLIPNGTWCQWFFDDAPHGTLLVRNRTPGGGGGSGCAVQTPDLRVEGFHHLVVVYTGGAGVLYVDGAPLALELPDHAGDLALSFPATAASLGGEFSTITWSGNLAHAAFYPGALTPCQVLSHYDLATSGHYTPCLDWVRLIHAGGRGDWRTNGERIEERAAGKLSRVHDGTTSTVYSDEHAVLQTPLAVLDASPPQLVGRDPSTALPAYCPPPAVVNITPAPPVVVPGGADPDEIRCNVAHYVAGQMATAYGYAAAKINTLNSIQNGLVSVLAPLAGVILALLDIAFPPLLIITGIALTLLAALAQYHDTHELLPLGGPAQEAIAKALYCALVPDSGGLYQITGTTLFNWSYNLTTFGADFTGNQLSEVRLLITVYQMEYWHNLALQAGAEGSTLCAGYSCSGLLP